MVKRKLKIAELALIISLIALGIALINFWDLKKLYCDLQESIFAERRFIQSSVREIDQEGKVDFDEKIYYPNGEEVLNPITTKLKYAKYCN